MSATQQQLQLAMANLLGMHAIFDKLGRAYEAEQAGRHEHLNIIQHTALNCTLHTAPTSLMQPYRRPLL